MQTQKTSIFSPQIDTKLFCIIIKSSLIVFWIEKDYLHNIVRYEYFMLLKRDNSFHILTTALEQFANSLSINELEGKFDFT